MIGQTRTSVDPDRDILHQSRTHGHHPRSFYFGDCIPSVSQLVNKSVLCYSVLVLVLTLGLCVLSPRLSC